MTRPMDPPGEPPTARLPEDSTALRDLGAPSGTGFRVEPRSTVPARTVPAPRTELAPRTGLSPRTSSERRLPGPEDSPGDGGGEEGPAGR